MSVLTAERFPSPDDSEGPDFRGNDGRLEFDPYSKPRKKVIADLALYGTAKEQSGRPGDLITASWWDEMILDDGMPDPLAQQMRDDLEPWERSGGVARMRPAEENEEDSDL